MKSNTGFFASDPNNSGRIWFLGTQMRLAVNSAQTNGAFGLIEQTLPPGFAPPLHVHHREDEAFYVIEGKISFTCGEETFEAFPGTFIFLPRDVPHGFRVKENQSARLLQFSFPGGLEEFFIEAGYTNVEAEHRLVTQEDIERMLRTAPKYGIEILSPH